MKIIGRQSERDQLRRYYESNRPEFLALYGRRRVGKTFLVKEFFNNDFTFYATGLAGAPKSKQLEAFTDALRLYGMPDTRTPDSWLQAFGLLRQLIGQSNRMGKKVVFIDEMPWFDSPRSGFLTALEYFWNSWASSQPDMLLIVCGSASTWMINKLLKDHGGLYNRVTQRMHLMPFTLGECEQFFKESHMSLSRYQILEYYMVFGGIPLYLDKVSTLGKGLSVAQSIDRLCFADAAPLRYEFSDMLASLFKAPERHHLIIRALAKKAKGLTRDELIKSTKLPNGGNLTKALEELEQSGFIRQYKCFDKKRKQSLYQLIDFFSSFHFRYLADFQGGGENYWAQFSNQPAHSAWTGYAFEQVCLLHVPQIKRKLGISGVLAPVYSWRSMKPSDAIGAAKTTKPSAKLGAGHGDSDVEKTGPKPHGAQIDLVIDRKDQIINLCEMKYSIDEFGIDSAYYEKLRNKKAAFIRETKTRKAVHITMITSYGLIHNAYWNHVQSEVTADDLFD